jgi:DNA-binding NarL/FixJ family response regulator
VYKPGLDLCRDRGEAFTEDDDLAPRQPGLLAAEVPRLRIVIVSEVRFRREILAEFLERDASVSVVGLCADLAEVVALSPPLQADLVLVDAALRDGAAAARRTRQVKPDVRIIAYAVRETKDDVIAWAEAGVIGYVPNTAASADLVRLIMDIHAGEQPCSGRVAAELLHRIALPRASALAAMRYPRHPRSPGASGRHPRSDRDGAQ